MNVSVAVSVRGLCLWRRRQKRKVSVVGCDTFLALSPAPQQLLPNSSVKVLVNLNDYNDKSVSNVKLDC